MHHRSRYKLSFPPFAIVTACAGVLLAMWLGPLDGFLARQSASLEHVVRAVVILLPIAFSLWYWFSWADVRLYRLTIRSTFSASRVDLRTLAHAQVYEKPAPTFMSWLLGLGGFGMSTRRRQYELMLLLTDEAGSSALLPLNTWRQEDLLMARILRATVERKVRIDGERMLVRRFTALLDSYKSWDHQQAAA